MESSREGMRTLWTSLGVLGVTALIQAAVTAASGSVALLGDTLHNAVALCDGHGALLVADSGILGGRSHCTVASAGARSSNREERDAHGALPRRLHALRPMDLHIARPLSPGAKRASGASLRNVQVGAGDKPHLLR